MSMLMQSENRCCLVCLHRAYGFVRLSSVGTVCKYVCGYRRVAVVLFESSIGIHRHIPLNYIFTQSYSPDFDFKPLLFFAERAAGPGLRAGVAPLHRVVGAREKGESQRLSLCWAARRRRSAAIGRPFLSTCSTPAEVWPKLTRQSVPSPPGLGRHALA